MTAKKSDPILVIMTAANGEEAARLAEMLVGAQLAACVQILPGIESVFRWKGRIERQAEVLLLAKTVASRFDELEREVRALHSYETPEIVALPLTSGSEPYLEWVATSLRRQNLSDDGERLLSEAQAAG